MQPLFFVLKSLLITSEDVATVKSSELLVKIQFADLDLILRERENASLVWTCQAF